MLVSNKCKVKSNYTYNKTKILRSQKACCNAPVLRNCQIPANIERIISKNHVYFFFEIFTKCYVQLNLMN